MSRKYILTLMAANRVGILATVTRALYDLKADLQEVSQTVMSKFFTIILEAEFPGNQEPDEVVSRIESACAKYGVEVSIKEPAKETLQPDPDPQTEKYFLTISGHDEPGIICEITSMLRENNIDVIDLYAVRDKTDRSFVMIMELSVHGGIDAVELQQSLETLGTSAGLAASLQHENIFLATNDPRPVRIAIPH